MFSFQDHFNYVADDYLDAKILELPYKNSNLSMFVYLPNSNNGLSRLESKLRGVDLTNVLQSMTPHRVTVSFPKFKSALSVILNKALINVRQIHVQCVYTLKYNFYIAIRWVWKEFSRMLPISVECCSRMSH